MSTQQLHCDNSDKNADDLQQRSGREHSIEERHDARLLALVTEPDSKLERLLAE
jgi:hypothetical protein